ncbi:hypothetical protein ACES2L_13390 [Bdellovibrio bacteriovorus]
MNLRAVSVLSSVTLISSIAMAISLGNFEGESRKEFKSPRNLTELCVIGKKWPGADYRSDDIKKEATLCGYDFYTNMGVCPKYNSTNPAILLLEPNAQYTKQQIDASNCDVKKMGVKTEAKFKQSITCSYTPAILAYYHLSRIFGNAGRVPPAVIRTMDISIHKRLTDKAINTLNGTNKPILASWEKVLEVHQNPRFFPAVVDAQSTQFYGALSDNPKNEEQYVDVSGVGKYDTRYERFMNQEPFKRLISSASVSQMVGTSDFARVAQTVLQLKDVSDMILMDTLLNQQDRIGNIHYKFFWYYIDPVAKKVVRQKSDAKWVNDVIQVPDQENAAMAGKQAALVKEMLLKDNDCGVTKTNMMKKYKVLEQIRHMSYNTYKKFMAFEQALATPAGQDYFVKELLFSPSEFRNLQRNAAEAKQILKTKCQSNQLRFDVDIELYVPGASAPTPSC